MKMIAHVVRGLAAKRRFIGPLIHDVEDIAIAGTVEDLVENGIPRIVTK